MSNSGKTLLALLGVLALALVYAYINWPRQTRFGIERSPVVSPVTDVTPSASDVLGTSENEQGAPDHLTVNIFAPIFVPAVAPPIAAGVEDSPQTVVAAPVMPPPRPVPVFLGVLRHEGGQKAFLSLEGEVFVVAAGDLFGPENRYRLLDISAQYLTVKYDEEDASMQIPAAEPPVSVLPGPGTGNGIRIEPDATQPAGIPLQTEASEEEVPIDGEPDE